MSILKNPRHEKFIQNIVSGMSQRQAYREAFPSAKKWKDSVVDSRASDLFSGKVLVRYQELIKQQETEALLTRHEKRKLLADVARDKTEKSENRIRAIDLDNKMEGEYTEKLSIDGDFGMNISVDYGDDDDE